MLGPRVLARNKKGARDVFWLMSIQGVDRILSIERVT
jgi:hypothetical protein